MSAYPAEVIGRESSKSHARLVIVTDPNHGEVRVRWTLERAQAWRCDECGPMNAADCMHTFSAGLVLAEALLGLTRVPELHPMEGPHRD